jgi:hypothetical protein
MMGSKLPKPNMVKFKHYEMYSSISWDTTFCSLLKESQHFRRTCRRHLLALVAACFMLVSCFLYSLTLMIDATCSSEMSADIQWTTACYIPGERTSKSYNIKCISVQYF